MTRVSSCTFDGLCSIFSLFCRQRISCRLVIDPQILTSRHMFTSPVVFLGRVDRTAERVV